MERCGAVEPSEVCWSVARPTLGSMPDPLLFQPFTLRGLEVRNRLWVSPMCQYSCPSAGRAMGVPGDWHLQHIGALARGGAGLVVVEATGVVPEGRISPHCPGLWNDAQQAAFARLALIAHSHGARIAIQLGHAGRKASVTPMLPGETGGSVPFEAGGWQTVAPSAIAYGDLAAPRALTLDEIAQVRQAFVASASRAVEAGFDAVELHAAHGYLLHQFLSPFSNQRTDIYGGSPQNRARLLREIVRDIRAEHPRLPLLVRISATEWVDGGFDVASSRQLAGWLAEDGVDLIDVSSAANVPQVRVPVGPSYQVGLAAEVRQAGLPVGAVGLITSAEQAEGILASGQADVVFLGRALLENPHLPLAWAHRLGAPHAAQLVPPQYFRARFRG